MADYSALNKEQIIYLLLNGNLTPIEAARITDIIQTELDGGQLVTLTWHSPVTLAEVISELSDPNTFLEDKFKIEEAVRRVGSRGELPSLDPLLASPTVKALGPASTLDDWVVRAIRSAINTITSDPGVSAQWRQFAASTTSDTTKFLFKVGLGILEQLVTAFATATASATPVAAKLAGQTMNQILGVSVNDTKLETLFSGDPSRAAMVGIGAEFQKVVELMFPLGFAHDNVVNRGERAWSKNNLEAFMGTNMAFQLRSLTIGTIASFVPEFNLEHLEGLHQSINWAYGFGWLSWTVLSAIMNVTTTKPLTEYYNSQVLGNDFSEAEALNAFVQKRIERSTLDQVLNNQGMRPDIRDVRIAQTRVGLTAEKAVKGYVEGIIDRARLDTELNDHKIKDEVRDTLIEEARPQLTESDVQQMFDHGLAGESDVSDHYKRKGFADYNLQAKIDLVKDDRTFRLQQQLTNDYFKAFTLGKVTQDEYTQYLNSQGYTQIQVDIELHRAALDMRPPKVKHLTVAEVLAQVTRGAWTATQGLQRLLDMGWDRQDATDLLSFAVVNHALDLIPRKIKDACLGPDVEANLLAAAISTATQLDPTYPIRAKDFMEQAACVLRNLTSSSGGGTTPPPVNRPPAPLSLVGAPGSRSVALAWQPIPMLADYQVYRRQIGSGTFSPVNAPSVATTFVDSNLTPGEIYIYVVRSQVNGVESDNSNEVQVQAIA